MRLEGARIVLSGAGSGIGRALAHGLAERGARTILIDRNDEGLRETAAGLAGEHSLHVFDVTDAGAVERLAREVADRHGAVDGLINNAGIAVSGGFEDTSEADFDRCMAVNFQATVRLTRLFLPLVRADAHPGAKRSEQRRIVNVSSVFGLIGPLGQSAYSASKFAVSGFSQSLRADLYGTGIGVSVVYPGGVATNIARAALVPDAMTQPEREHRLEVADKLLVMPPARAARTILRGIERGRDRIVIGRDAHAGDLVSRVLPNGYAALIRRMGVEL